MKLCTEIQLSVCPLVYDIWAFVVPMGEMSMVGNPTVLVGKIAHVGMELLLNHNIQTGVS